MGRPRKVGKCPQHLPNDQKCNGCQRGRGCTGMPPVATELDLATESTSEPPRPQPFADTDEHVGGSEPVRSAEAEAQGPRA